jgi:tetratricopeptide (TPR) repeat protein
MIGDAYMRLGNYGLALRRYQNALSLNPGSKEVDQKIRRARGAEAARESILINDEKASVAIRSGEAFMLRGDYHRAIYSFESALKLTPGSAGLRERLERAYRAKAAENAVLR